MNRGVVRSLLGAAAFATLGCSDPVGPERFAGTYELERYEGMQLPAVSVWWEGGSSTVESDRIVLRANGTGSRTTTVRVVSAESPEGSTSSPRQALVYTGSASRIEITFACPPEANCVPGPHLTGSLTEAGRLALGPPASSKPASLYKRVR